MTIKPSNTNDIYIYIYITKPLVTNYIKCFRWCLDMLVRLRLKKKQCHTCLVNHEPQFVFMWVLVKTTVQLQKMKSNYTLLFMRFSSLSSPILLQLLSQLSFVPLSISQRLQKKPNKLMVEGCCRSITPSFNIFLNCSFMHFTSLSPPKLS